MLNQMIYLCSVSENAVLRHFAIEGIAMACVTYIDHDGTQHKVEVRDGESVMQGALNNMISGIVAECGGGMACATCHCYVDAAWVDRVGPPASASEKEMLESAAAEKKLGSRLSCQITVSRELDGLVIHLPESQY
jgi:2Fe-2S ferredoxin